MNTVVWNVFQPFLWFKNWSKKFLWSRHSLMEGILVLLGWKHIPKGNQFHMNALSALSAQKLFSNTLHLFCICENCLTVATFLLLFSFMGFHLCLILTQPHKIYYQITILSLSKSINITGENIVKLLLKIIFCMFYLCACYVHSPFLVRFKILWI